MDMAVTNTIWYNLVLGKVIFFPSPSLEEKDHHLLMVKLKRWFCDNYYWLFVAVPLPKHRIGMIINREFGLYFNV